MSGVTESLRGRLLVAAPTLLDPNFYRTVVLLLDHDDDGALGVILNRPSELQLEDGLPGWERLATAPPVVFLGGPVSPGTAICLGRRRTETAPEWFQPVLGRLGLLDPARDIEELATGVDAARVCSGYAGWGAEQLRDELAEGAWFVLDADEDDVTSTEPEGLWSRVLRRQPAPVSWAANCPIDPTLN